MDLPLLLKLFLNGSSVLLWFMESNLTGPGKDAELKGGMRGLSSSAVEDTPITQGGKISMINDINEFIEILNGMV